MTISGQILVEDEAVSLTELQTLFGGSPPINLSEYYRGGTYVQDVTDTQTTSTGDFTSNIPTSGSLSLNNFRGAAKALQYSQATSPVITGISSSVSADFSIVDYLHISKRGEGDTFRVTSQLRSETAWDQYPILSETFTIGTSASITSPTVGDKQYFMNITYDGDVTVTLNGYYAGSSTSFPDGGLYLDSICPRS